MSGQLEALDRTLILTPRGRDAAVARGILTDARLRSEVCSDLPKLVQEIARGADLAILAEEAIHNADTRELLRDLGYEVHEAGSGGAALDLLEREPHVDLMLVDFAMPGMSGADVARRVHTTKPFMPTLFITGFADRAALAGVSESHIIGKPFHQTELAYKVRVALAEADAGHVAGLSLH